MPQIDDEASQSRPSSSMDQDDNSPNGRGSNDVDDRVSDAGTELGKPEDGIGSGDEGFESDEPIRGPDEPKMEIVNEIKDILTNLDDEGLDRLFEMIPMLSEKEIAFYDKNENSWLHWLAVSKNLHTVDTNKLVSTVIAFSLAGINYNKRNTTKNTALHFAVACKAPLRMINAMLKIGIDPSFKNDKQRLARHCTDDRAIIKTLEMFTPPLDDMIRAGETEKVTDLLTYWVKVTNYHTDIARRNPPLRDLLLEKRIQIDLIYYALTGNTEALLESDEDLLQELPNLYDDSYINTDGDVVPLPLLFLLITNPYCIECAKLLLQRGCDVNFPVSYKGDGKMVPFWIWFMSSEHSRKDELLPLIQDNIDYQASVDCITHEHMLDFLSDNREIFDHLIEKGYAFWKLDEMFRNLNDLALYNVLKSNKKELQVDKIFVKMEEIDEALLPFFRKWDDDKLQNLQDIGYWPLLSYPTLEKLEKSKDQNDVKLMWRLKGLEEKWVSFRQLRYLIQMGNTAGFRDVATVDACQRRDKASQSLIHYAVIFERRFILKHILDKKPTSVDWLDHNGRTAMHYSQGIEEEFIYNLLDRAGADKYIADKTVSSGNTRRNSVYPLLSDPDMVQSFYRQAIRVERREVASYSFYLLHLYLVLHDSIVKNNEERFNRWIHTLWPDLTWELFSKVNKMFPNQPHKLPNLISFCIVHQREEFGRELLRLGHPLDSEVRTADGVFMIEEFARKEGLHQLADDIEAKKNTTKKAAPEEHVYHSDEGDTIFSVYTANSGNSVEEEANKPKKKKKHKNKDGSKDGKKKKKKKGKDNKVEDSEVCTIL